MLINLLSTFFLSTKFYLSIHDNKNYIPTSKALNVIIIATLLDDVAYYVFDNKYALSNFSFIFYFFEIIISVFFLSMFSRLLGAGHKISQYNLILKAYSYTLSPVIIGSIILIIISISTSLNETHPQALSIGALIVLMGWLWVCQFLMINTIFKKIGFIKRIFLFLITVSIYIGMDKFKKFIYMTF
tara:strand:- start:6373 stop:6930 length:558 start_codon:yes stop_codon:yes gene_type:complete